MTPCFFCCCCAQLLFLYILRTGKTLLACKKSCCAITFVSFCSWPILITPRVSLLPRGFSVFKMVSVSASPPPAKKSFNTSHASSSRARWPLVSNFCPRATRKSQIFHTNHMLGTLDFTVSEHWAPFNFPSVEHRLELFRTKDKMHAILF